MSWIVLVCLDTVDICRYDMLAFLSIASLSETANCISSHLGLLGFHKLLQGPAIL